MKHKIIFIIMMLAMVLTAQVSRGQSDIEDAINCAQKIGDDYLQKQARGYAQPETFNHGTSAQRARWFKRGLDSGRFDEAPTFRGRYEDL